MGSQARHDSDVDHSASLIGETDYPISGGLVLTANRGLSTRRMKYIVSSGSKGVNKNGEKEHG